MTGLFKHWVQYTALRRLQNVCNHAYFIWWALIPVTNASTGYPSWTCPCRVVSIVMHSICMPMSLFSVLVWYRGILFTRCNWQYCAAIYLHVTVALSIGNELGSHAQLISWDGQVVLFVHVLWSNLKKSFGLTYIHPYPKHTVQMSIESTPRATIYTRYHV